VLDAGRPGETYNVGGRAERENLELVGAVCDVADRLFAECPALSGRFPNAPASLGRPARSLITFVADRPGEGRCDAIDGWKIERELGFTPQTSPAKGLRWTVAWYLDHEPW